MSPIFSWTLPSQKNTTILFLETNHEFLTTTIILPTQKFFHFQKKTEPQFFPQKFQFNKNPTPSLFTKPTIKHHILGTKDVPSFHITGPTVFSSPRLLQQFLDFLLPFHLFGGLRGGGERQPWRFFYIEPSSQQQVKKLFEYIYCIWRSLFFEKPDDCFFQLSFLDLRMFFWKIEDAFVVPRTEDVRAILAYGSGYNLCSFNQPASKNIKKFLMSSQVITPKNIPKPWFLGYITILDNC